MALYHIRLMPYDEGAGALCRRLTVGGQQFREGEWYDMLPEHAEQLRPLKQRSGCPFFHIVETEEAWREIVREELAAAMAGPEAAAMARYFSQASPQSGPPPKAAGEQIPSAFDGIKAAPVDRSAIGAVAGESISKETPKTDPKKAAPKKKSPTKRGGSRKKK
jgi:hypothetical protein